MSKNIYEKLLDIQATIETPRKDATNPFHKNKYASLDSVHKIVIEKLKEHGILLMHICTGDALKTVLRDVESSDEVSSTLSLVGMTDMQKAGSAITYARRYTLVALLGLLTEEDDDGNGASGYTNKDKKPYKAPAKKEAVKKPYVKPAAKTPAKDDDDDLF